MARDSDEQCREIAGVQSLGPGALGDLTPGIFGTLWRQDRSTAPLGRIHLSDGGHRKEPCGDQEQQQPTLHVLHTVHFIFTGPADPEENPWRPMAC